MAGLLPWCGQKRWGGGGLGVPIVEALFCIRLSVKNWTGTGVVEKKK